MHFVASNTTTWGVLQNLSQIVSSCQVNVIVIVKKYNQDMATNPAFFTGMFHGVIIVYRQSSKQLVFFLTEKDVYILRSVFTIYIMASKHYFVKMLYASVKSLNSFSFLKHFFG